jgi:hypothetical protein
LQDNAYIAQNIHPLWTNREFDRILREMIDEEVQWTTVPTGEVSVGAKYSCGSCRAGPMPFRTIGPKMLTYTSERTSLSPSS